MEVDHINGNKLDNRRANLRIVTKQGNMQNRRGANKNSKSGVLGVSPESGKYRARLNVGNDHFNLGLYKNIEEAAQAVKIAKDRLGFLSGAENG